jgi:hypothetical protein
MTEQQHPITPPPELVERLRNDAPREIRDAFVTRERHLIIAAYCAGADQELEACVKWIEDCGYHPSVPEDLRAARRPKPPSLAEQALEALDQADKGLNESEWQQRSDTIRRALERLQELENNG